MLCLPCNALFQGVGSGIWAWTMDATGAAAKTWKTTAPLFQEAFQPFEAIAKVTPFISMKAFLQWSQFAKLWLTLVIV